MKCLKLYLKEEFALNLYPNCVHVARLNGPRGLRSYSSEIAHEMLCYGVILEHPPGMLLTSCR